MFKHPTTMCHLCWAPGLRKNLLRQPVAWQVATIPSQYDVGCPRITGKYNRIQYDLIWFNQIYQIYITIKYNYIRYTTWSATMKPNDICLAFHEAHLHRLDNSDLPDSLESWVAELIEVGGLSSSQHRDSMAMESESTNRWTSPPGPGRIPKQPDLATSACSLFQHVAGLPHSKEDELLAQSILNS